MKKINSASVSVEQSVKAQFAKVFSQSDWLLFKRMAESNLREAAELQKADMPVKKPLKLRARNSRKRLLIGVGVELLLKAIYLRKGFAINKPEQHDTLKFPFRLDAVGGVPLAKDKTFMLDELIVKLPKIVSLRDPALTLKGLKIAKVFRNKEGHVVTREHGFYPSNYRDIEASLVHLYEDALREVLSVRFSIAKNERAVWLISPVKT